MADFLYVCQFSNGHIKVGRSIDPVSRVAVHSERVSCMGVELADHFIVECVGPASPRESQLIRRCAEEAESRFQNEWFSGLDYLTVCDWAGEAARLEIHEAAEAADTFGYRLIQARRAKGLTQGQLAQGLGQNGRDLNKAAVSTWELDQCSPNVTQLRLMCERLGVSSDYLVFGVTQSQPA